MQNKAVEENNNSQQTNKCKTEMQLKEDQEAEFLKNRDKTDNIKAKRKKTKQMKQKKIGKRN